MRGVLLWMLGLLMSQLACAQVTYQRITHADQEPGSWLTYSRSYDGHRYSPLSEINRENVTALRVKWAYQFSNEWNETSPIVVDGVMYLTGPNSALALDARTGKALWSWHRELPPDFKSLGFGHVNRGPAVLDDKLFVTTLDGYLVALDLKSGARRWATQVADYKLGYSMTVAPLAVDGKVITGISGGEGGVRGFLDAYDAATGHRLWRFWTIPSANERGHETWSGDSATRGGGPTWVTGAYDPALSLVYWGVGNPSPDWNGDARQGDNLFTDSLIALDVNTGRLRWYFQFTPHDTHDWDSAHVPVLIDAQLGGRQRRLVANANRNGFYYLLDRETGEFVSGQAYAKQTWARGLDAKGRPIVLPNSEPSSGGTLIWPNANGATIWLSPSYSPPAELFFIPVRQKGAVYFKRDMEFKPGSFYPGGGEIELPESKASGEILALEATTGNARWRFPLLSPGSAGILSTGGGLVFSGTNEGNFFALDATNGQALWNFQTGADGFGIQANPISFSIDNHQFIAISADRVLFVFGL